MAQYYTGNVTISGSSGVTVPSASVTATSGYVLTSGGTSYPNWTAASSYGTNSKVNITSEGLNLAEDTDIKFGNVSLKETLESINSRLAILVPNPKLESEFDELKQLAEQYRELEKKLIEQSQMWDLLKKADN